MLKQSGGKAVGLVSGASQIEAAELWISLKSLLGYWCMWTTSTGKVTALPKRIDDVS